MGVRRQSGWVGVGFGVMILGASASACPQFAVSFEPAVRTEAASGRLVVYLIADHASLGGREPADGPFFESPQPMFGIDVSGLAPGTQVMVGDGAGVASFPAPICDLPVGGYRVQAVLDMAKACSSWAGEPGNLYSMPQRITIPEKDDPAWATFTVPITLGQVVEDAVPGAFAEVENAALFELKSELLSTFHGREVKLRAGVVYPDDYDKTKQYPAFIVVPGFGGDHTMALGDARRRAMRRDDERRLFDANLFLIVLDPESGNGHHLFADSACNGPVGTALVKEFVPALTKRFNLIDDADARIVRGHSSGGWSALWLILNYPETFGYAYSSAPDPVDFRAFQAINLYSDVNAYETTTGPVPSYRTQTILGDDVKMTVAQENHMEEVLGPDNTSGQQWDSWFAVFAPRQATGHPSAVWNPETGVIDCKVAEACRKYDIADMVRRDPQRFGPIFRERISLLVGSRDSFYLERAVKLLLNDLREAGFAPGPEDGGVIKVILDADHGSVLGSPEAKAMVSQVLDRLRVNGILVRTTPPDQAPTTVPGTGQQGAGES